MGYSFQLTARFLLYAPSHRQDNTYHSLCYTSRGALAGMRNSSNPGQIHEVLPRGMLKCQVDIDMKHIYKLKTNVKTLSSIYWSCISECVLVVQEERKETVYLMTYSTHLGLYGIKYMVWTMQIMKKKTCSHYELLLLISSKGSFICTIPQTGQYIPQLFLLHLWNTGWNKKQFIGSTNRDRSYNPPYLVSVIQISLMGIDHRLTVHQEGACTTELGCTFK